MPLTRSGNQLTDRRARIAPEHTDGADFRKSSDNRNAAQASASHEAGLMRYCACEVGNQEASMTTKVTVETHDWPVAVSVKDTVVDGYRIGVRRVEPHSKEEFHLTDTRTIKFEELPKPEVAEPAGDTVAA